MFPLLKNIKALKTIFLFILTIFLFNKVFAANATIIGEIKNNKFEAETGLIQLQYSTKRIPTITGFRREEFKIVDNKFLININDFEEGMYFLLIISNVRVPLIIYNNDKINLKLNLSRVGQAGKYPASFTGEKSGLNNCLQLITKLEKPLDFRGFSIEEIKSMHKWVLKCRERIIEACVTKDDNYKNLNINFYTYNFFETNKKQLSLSNEDIKVLKQYSKADYFYNLFLIERKYDEFPESKFTLENSESFYQYSDALSFIKSFKILNHSTKYFVIWQLTQLKFKKEALENNTGLSDKFVSPSTKCQIAETLFRGKILHLLYTAQIYNYLVQGSTKDYDFMLSQFKRICDDETFIRFIETERKKIN